MPKPGYLPEVMFATALVLFGVLLPALLDIGLFVLIGIILFFVSSGRKRSLSIVLRVAIVLEITALCLLFYELRRPTLAYTDLDYMKRYGPFAILTGMDVGQREIAVFHRRSVVYSKGLKGTHNLPKNDYTVIDPFTFEPYRQRSDGPYSVGPDGVNDNMAILYDPTNGTFSRGDISFDGVPESSEADSVYTTIEEVDGQ